MAALRGGFARYVGAPHAVAVNSCTAALHLRCSRRASEPGDEVITTPLTFCATANAIMHAGATPVFADVRPPHEQHRPGALSSRRITPRTKALLPVHFAGRPCDMDASARSRERHGLHVIEDAPTRIETAYHGRRPARSATSPASASTSPRT